MRNLFIGLAAVTLTTSAAAIVPGNWEATSVLADLTLPPDVPAGAEDMLRSMLGGEGMTSQHCVTQEDIDSAPERIFQETDGQCEYSQFDMSGGQMHAVAQCNMDDGGVMNMTMDGTYTDTTYSMTMQMQGDAGMGPMTMSFDVAGHRVGDCS